MKAVIVSYRRGRHTQKLRQAIVKIEGIKNREEAKKLIGKEVEISFSKASIKGKITRAHGNNGKVVVLFERGMPGQAIGKEIKING
ncbi:MAG: 50S ribosomal protein L35ae [Candidatus Rehaiarchaeum fermentans]|nr:50S ribosomal protein L35ae [Candidatus Rehaiarchaeum fermentans]MCW1297334.1 50S ribosomal protein L35ae [Candidatus Rehaiarchaeum fermentans]MCW1302341.1 50S ribosomal protein L35ae [Candidatus Rehaiarchaeum fermentans]